MTAHPGGRWLRWPREVAGEVPAARIAFGADYNPEQWPRHVWDEDVRLMKEAGVNIVSLAIFSWSQLQPTASRWEFGWLADVLDLLHANDVAVCLATATASPPPWLTAKHPEVLPVTRTGETVWPGARQHWRPTSPVFRSYALELVRALAQRYGDHPALAAWHVSNELGCHNVYDYSDDAADAFRSWLRTRYQTIEGLNAAWGTSFWSQRYSAWDEVLPPRQAASFPNPTQQLDFKRFSSDALKEYLRAERDLLYELTPDIPVTTNFMVMSKTQEMNYADWAAEVDFVANDHYLHADRRRFDEMSFSANLTSGIAGGRPWFLMEHSTSAVNWQPVNLPKRDGELARDSLTHVAHGADAVCFFQWRQSLAGAEKYHSALVPHAGEDSAVFRAVTDLGTTLQGLAEVAGSPRLRARVGILFDWESWWVSELDSHPTSLLRYHDEALSWYAALLDAGVRSDVLPTSAAFDEYDVILAPILHVVPAHVAERLTTYVAGGGHLLTTYFSGVVDENDHVWPGGYPGALRDLLGIRIEEFSPLPADEHVRLDNDAGGTLWSEAIDVVAGTEVLARYTTGAQADRPAITRRPGGEGSTTYVSTRLDDAGRRWVLQELLGRAAVTPELPEAVTGRIELAIRYNDTAEYWFLINRGEAPVPIDGIDGEVLACSAQSQPTTLVVGGRSVAVLRRPHRGT